MYYDNICLFRLGHFGVSMIFELSVDNVFFPYVCRFNCDLCIILYD